MEHEEKESTKQVPIVSRGLSNGTLIVLVYLTETKQTALAVYINGKSEVVPSYRFDDGSTAIPIKATNNLIRHCCVLLPSAPQPYSDVATLLSTIQSYLHRYVDLSPTFLRIASAYVLLSWVYDAFNELPYLRFRGDYGSGKTRALLVLGSICYKPFFASGASTVSPIFHALDTFQGTLIFDETDFRFSGRIAESLDWVNEMLAMAEAAGDPDLLILGHRAACGSYFYRGDLTQSCEPGDRVLALYSDEKHRHLADIMNMDPKTTAGVFVSLGAWMLGYPDRALQVSDAKNAHARRRGHPFDLGYALTGGGQVWDYRCEPEPLLARAEEAERLGRAHSLPFISEVMAQMYKGLAWLRAGRLADGIPHLQIAIERWNAPGARLLMPYLRAALAEGLALSGDLEGGLNLIENSLTQIARPGWEERSHLAEVLRLKGWMQQWQGKLDAAEENYLASLDVAREQEAKSWELRTSTSLARLWQSQGKHKEAYELLAPVYNWFTEGFDTKDLKQAKALLEELAA